MTIFYKQPGRSKARGRELWSPEGMCKRGYPAGYGGNRLQYLAGVVRPLKPWLYYWAARSDGLSGAEPECVPGVSILGKEPVMVIDSPGIGTDHLNTMPAS